MDWALSVAEPRQWFFVGALGTEERSRAAWSWLKELGLEGGRTLVQVDPINETRFSAATRQRLALRRGEFIAAGGSEAEIAALGLFSELYEIERMARQLSQRASSIIFDISSLPKRFFFPLLRAFIRSQAVRDLVLTYTCPEDYQSEDKLSEGAGKWDYLPGFLGKERRGGKETLIASVGFMIESLQGHLSGEEAHPAVQLLIPFPAPPSAIRRSWESVFNLQSTRDPGKFVKHRVDAFDVSSAFDCICSLARDSDTVAFAPFGPKSISAAMCIYADQENSAIHYPQPNGYHPDYSVGVAMTDGKPFVNAYWVKHEGVNLYKVIK